MNIANLKQMIVLAESMGATDESDVYVCIEECINIGTPKGYIRSNWSEGIILEKSGKSIKWVSNIPDLKVRMILRDNGLCRTYFRPVDKKDKRLFCTQPDAWWAVHWYICSSDGEPSHIHTTERLLATE